MAEPYPSRVIEQNSLIDTQCQLVRRWKAGRITHVLVSERYAAEHQTAQTSYLNKVKKMLIKWKKSEKEVFSKLVAQGNDLHVSGSGYHFNGKCFKSFREFWKFCQDQLDK